MCREKNNQVVDTLFRAALESILEGICFEAITASQTTDPEVQAYHTALLVLQLEDVLFRSKGNTILCDTSTGQPRPVVPEERRRRVFDVIHGLSHPSIRTSRRLIASMSVFLPFEHGGLVQLCLQNRRDESPRRIAHSFNCPHVLVGNVVQSS